MLFRDRREAGRLLARRLDRYAGRPGTLVLALPRGGVPVAYEVARALRAPLDVFVVRKLGLPEHEELAIGAVASGGTQILNELAFHSDISAGEIRQVIRKEGEELARRERAYRGDRPPLEVRGLRVILVDDGLATGSSMRAAITALRKLAPSRIVVAVPVAPRETCADLENEADEVVCDRTPEPFQAVGRWYADFAQTTDAEVRDLLERVERAREEMEKPESALRRGA